MTVRDLINRLEDFDDDMEVCIGMQQNYGSDWAYGICDADELEVNNYDRNEEEARVVLTMGRQFGTVHYEGGF